MLSTLTCAAALLLAVQSGDSTLHRAPPNVVLILADDLGYGDAGCYNDASKVPTPNLDRLATQGMRFTDAHSPSAVCTPTRYGILTGRYSWRSQLKSGVLGNGYARTLIEPGRPTIATLLRDAGYRTSVVGKWHLGMDWQSSDGSVITASNHDAIDYTKPATGGASAAGFDYSYLIPASLDMEPYCYVQNGMPTAAPTDRVEASAHRRQNGGGFWRAGAASPGFDHQQVLPELQRIALQQLDGDAPFFLYFPLTAPHTPWVPTDEFSVSTEIGHYGDFVAQVDATVGAVMNELDRLGIADNTLLIVTSDNGSHWPPADITKYGHRANGPWRGQKADVWEGGHRVPMLIRWPVRIDAGAVNDDLVCLTDLFATVAAAVEIEVPDEAGEDSRDHLLQWQGAAVLPRRNHVVHHSHRGMYAIRRGPWKLILGQGSGGFSNPRGPVVSEDLPPGQLYHLQSDPEEQDNVYDERPDVVAELTELLNDIRNSVVVDDDD